MRHKFRTVFAVISRRDVARNADAGETMRDRTEARSISHPEDLSCWVTECRKHGCAAYYSKLRSRGFLHVRIHGIYAKLPPHVNCKRIEETDKSIYVRRKFTTQHIRVILIAPLDFKLLAFKSRILCAFSTLECSNYSVNEEVNFLSSR